MQVGRVNFEVKHPPYLLVLVLWLFSSKHWTAQDTFVWKIPWWAAEVRGNHLERHCLPLWAKIRPQNCSGLRVACFSVLSTLSIYTSRGNNSSSTGKSHVHSAKPVSWTEDRSVSPQFGWKFHHSPYVGHSAKGATALRFSPLLPTICRVPSPTILPPRSCQTIKMNYMDR